MIGDLTLMTSQASPLTMLPGTGGQNEKDKNQKATEKGKGEKDDTGKTGQGPASVNTEETKNGYKTTIRFDGYAIVLIIIFVIQIAFCIGICCYTNMQVQNAKRETVKQQAEFYQFLYQFHKQMADEEAALAAHYGKETTTSMGTPASGS